MKQLLLFTILMFAPASAPKRVYVCDGPYAKKYHGKKNCRGLENCSGSIKSISLQEAREMGRTPCRIKGCL